MIAVETIQFNHDPGAATHDALNIRRDASASVTLPEWRRYACVSPEDSPAAYSVASTRNNPLTIWVTLSCTDPAVHQAEIRVPGHVRERTVPFPPGQEVFELIDPPVAHGQAGARDVEWHWEYRVPPHHDWHRMAVPTRHRLYTVLDIPDAPWSQNRSARPTPRCRG